LRKRYFESGGEAMKRSGFGPRKSSLKRSPFSPDRQTFERNQEAKKRVGLKRKAKRPTVAEGSKYLEACRGMRCFLQVSGICIAPWLPSESVVPCHSNQSKHGKGMGLKAKHEFTVPGCAACHRWIDQSGAPKDLKFSVWDRAYEVWAPVRARKMGLVEQQELEVA
jgi:hypothetical protein